ncbi:MAG: hypothetical protein WCO63_16005 [Bacteroidota bacterium]
MSAFLQKVNPWLVSVILALLMLITLISYNIRKVPVGPVTTVTDTIQGDSVPYAVQLPKPSPDLVYRDTGTARWFPMEVDTAAILAQHNTTNIYGDTLKNDSSALIVVIDTVRFNALQGRGLVFQNRRLTLIRSTPPVNNESPYDFYFGAAMGRSMNEFGIMPTVAILNRKGQMYQVSYDLIQKDIYIGALWKIQRKIKIP